MIMEDFKPQEVRDDLRNEYREAKKLYKTNRLQFIKRYMKIFPTKIILDKNK